MEVKKINDGFFYNKSEQVIHKCQLKYNKKMDIV